MIENIEEYIKPFSRLVCEIKREKHVDDVRKKVKEYFDGYPIKETLYGHEGRVWILIGWIITRIITSWTV